ncbi:23S rRNA pseudouridine1911/1915/1917 synthase [Lachnospiraceae bacterium XBB2008]|nr:23S rRNA pseudouridine1911/1915/1917 synthase [Lachnospiraceae bacterium XBB2008]
MNDDKVFFDIVDDEDDGERLDKWIANIHPGYSRNYLQALISDGKVNIDGKVITKNSYRIVAGTSIEMTIPESEIPDIEPWDHPLDIIYEDDDIIIVNKPKNMVVHPAPGHYNDTLVNALVYYCNDTLSGINGVIRPGIVHRIDKDTTGSLIVCKNDKAHAAIAGQLKVHSIKRTYRAIVCGVIDQDELTVSGFIGRDPRDRMKFTVTDDMHGKSAITHVKVLNRFKNHTEVECRLETGRTHQIRVHMDHIRHPVLGDPLYGHDLGMKPPMKLEGQCLHAYIIGFEHPSTGEYMEFSAPLPEYYEKLLTII